MHAAKCSAISAAGYCGWMTDTPAVPARRSRAAGRGAAVGLAVRAARSAPALPLEVIAESARTTSERLLAKLRTLSGRGPCAQVAAATASANGAPGPLAVALRHRVCPPSTARAAVKGRSKTAAAAAVGTPGWAARRRTGTAAPAGVTWSTGATAPRVLWTRAATSDRAARRGVASDPACPAVMLTRLTEDHTPARTQAEVPRTPTNSSKRFQNPDKRFHLPDKGFHRSDKRFHRSGNRFQDPDDPFRCLERAGCRPRRDDPAGAGVQAHHGPDTDTPPHPPAHTPAPESADVPSAP